jgi:hypothetical protein
MIRYKIQLPLVWTKHPWFEKTCWPPISPTFEDVEKMKSWCKSNVGTDCWNYYGVHKKVPCEFIFDHEEDLLAFRLTFGI